MDYESIYNRNYFSGRDSFFYMFGYGNNFFRGWFGKSYGQISAYMGGFVKGRVLDVGCAYGFTLERFPDSFEKFGIDVSAHAINVAKRRLPDANFKIGGAEDKFPYKDNYFDVVLANDLLEHLENPKKALESIHKVLKIGGVLYITTPNLNVVRRKIFSYADRKEHHISMFTHKELMDLLKSLGFKIEDHWTSVAFVDFKFSSGRGIESTFICRK